MRGVELLRDRDKCCWSSTATLPRLLAARETEGAIVRAGSQKRAIDIGRNAKTPPALGYEPSNDDFSPEYPVLTSNGVMGKCDIPHLDYLGFIDEVEVVDAVMP